MPHTKVALMPWQNVGCVVYGPSANGSLQIYVVPEGCGSYIACRLDRLPCC